MAKDWSLKLHDTLREGNTCVDSIAKFGARSSNELIVKTNSQDERHLLLKLPNQHQLKIDFDIKLFSTRFLKQTKKKLK
jgi:hypothetical protein